MNANDNPATMSAGNRGEWVMVRRSLAERTESMFRSVDPCGQLATEWLETLTAPPPSTGSPTLHRTNDGCDGVDAVRDALNVCLGHLTGGLDGDYRDCDPVELARAALAAAPQPSASSAPEAVLHSCAWPECVRLAGLEAANTNHPARAALEAAGLAGGENAKDKIETAVQAFMRGRPSMIYADAQTLRVFAATLFGEPVPSFAPQLDAGCLASIQQAAHPESAARQEAVDYTGLARALRDQRQADEYGELCTISRQAADEAAQIVERIAASTSGEGHRD